MTSFWLGNVLRLESAQVTLPTTGYCLQDRCCDRFQYGKKRYWGAGVAFTDMNNANRAAHVITDSHPRGPHDSWCKV
ncbi:CFF_collapsed_G0026180.mRNA.1.CDS.1 [Saccharomyces cerevisiae]|nr:CFF_collapsed_G0026180.mRNA.1.CDS.1 [Saccharomyces cerevisiae]